GGLRSALAGLSCATLFVTHHPAEALAFGDRIAVLEGGRLSQCGSRTDFLRHPRSRYAAEFLGVNLFEGDVVERHADGLASVAVEDGRIAIPDPGAAARVRLVIHPHHVVVSAT